MDAQRAAQVMEALRQLYPEAKPELNFANPYETLIATILSAQCTDKRVNMVTARLFPQYPDAFAMARLTPQELEPLIRECGLYHNKARNIVAASRALVEQYDGKVPSTRAEPSTTSIFPAFISWATPWRSFSTTSFFFRCMAAKS